MKEALELHLIASSGVCLASFRVCPFPLQAMISGQKFGKFQSLFLLQVKKALELYEQLRQRMGVVVVGPSGSGKTTLWRVLRQAMIKTGKQVKEYVMNPKAMPRQQVRVSVVLCICGPVYVWSCVYVVLCICGPVYMWSCVCVVLCICGPVLVLCICGPVFMRSCVYVVLCI